MNQIVFINLMRSIVQNVKPFRVYEDDVFIVSFPRSGNTWIRFFIANLRKKEFGINEVDYINIEFLCPDIHTFQFNHKTAKPRFLKSHFRCLSRYPKVIYLLRDPRDVSLSFFGMLVKRGYENRWNDFNQFWPDFLNGRVPYGRWSDHILSYERFTGSKLLIQYEKILQNPVNNILPLLDFLAIHKTDEEIIEALKDSSTKKLKMHSKKVNFIKDWEVYDEKKLGKIEQSKAISGKWLDILSHEQNDQIIKMWGSIMQRYGYDYTFYLS